MNLLGWTLASAIVMKDRKYVSFRKALINPVSITLLVKQVIVPLVGLLILLPLPLGKDFQTTLFILYATPVASIVLNFPEMLGKGQKEAANLVLLGTLLSIVTIPLLMLIYSMLGV